MLDKESKIKSSILESIVVICIMSIYIVYGASYLPLLILFIPVPFVVLGIRNGIKTNIVSLLITFLIVQVLLSSTSGATLLMAFGPLSFVLNYCIKSRKTKTETIIMSAVSFLIPLIALILLGGQIANVDFIKQAEVMLNQYLELQVEALESMGLSKLEILNTTNLLENLYGELLVLIPSFIGLFSLFAAFINYTFSAFVARKLGYGVVAKGSFSRFKLPNNIIPGIALMMLTGFIFRILKVNYHEAFLLNITFLVSTIFLIQGFAVIDYFFKKKGFKFLLRLLILVFIFIFIPIGGIILFLLGVFDSVFDMRKLRRKNS